MAELLACRCGNAGVNLGHFRSAPALCGWRVDDLAAGVADTREAQRGLAVQGWRAERRVGGFPGAAFQLRPRAIALCDMSPLTRPSGACRQDQAGD